MSSNTPAPIADRNDSLKKFDESSSSALYVEWSDSKVDEACEEDTTCDDSTSRSLYVEWPEQESSAKAKANACIQLVSTQKLAGRGHINRKSSIDTVLTTAGTVSANSNSSRQLVQAHIKKKPSLSRAASSISLGLKREMEHTEQSTSSNRSLGISGFLRRNASAGEISTNMSRRGTRMSELTSNSNWDDDDDGDKSINLEGMNRDASGSSRSIFNNFIYRAKDASSSNLSTYSKDRVSIKVRRASDFLYSSHHKQGSDDEKSLGTSSHHEHTICTCNRTGNRLHHDDCGIRVGRKLQNSSG